MLAKDVMTRSVATIPPDAEVQDIAALLIDRHISAVPVVDGDGRLLGIVSEGDLMRRMETGTERKRSWWLSLVTPSGERADEYVKSHGRHAADVMTRNVVTVAEDTPLDKVVDLFEEHGIKRAPVLADGKLVGIVSRIDLLRGLAARQAAAPRPRAGDDRTIHDAVLAAFREQDWAHAHSVGVTVDDGVVHLWGLVDTEEERNAYRVAAENTPGVRRVEIHFGRSPTWDWG